MPAADRDIEQSKLLWVSLILILEQEICWAGWEKAKLGPWALCDSLAERGGDSMTWPVCGMLTPSQTGLMWQGPAPS